MNTENHSLDDYFNTSEEDRKEYLFKKKRGKNDDEIRFVGGLENPPKWMIDRDSSASMEREDQLQDEKKEEVIELDETEINEEESAKDKINKEIKQYAENLAKLWEKDAKIEAEILVDYAERKAIARQHGFRNPDERDSFLTKTKGMSFLQKMNYLVENAEEFGLKDSTYYLLDASSDNPVLFADAIVQMRMYHNNDGKNLSSKLPCYADLKEELETIHNNMIMDIDSINSILAQGRCRQWNKKEYVSADGIRFCVFNQLRTPKQRLRAIAFAICKRNWKIYVEE